MYNSRFFVSIIYFNFEYRETRNWKISLNKLNSGWGLRVKLGSVCLGENIEYSQQYYHSKNDYLVIFFFQFYYGIEKSPIGVLYKINKLPPPALTMPQFWTFCVFPNIQNESKNESKIKSKHAMKVKTIELEVRINR